MAADGHLGMAALSRVTLASAGLSCLMMLIMMWRNLHTIGSAFLHYGADDVRVVLFSGSCTGLLHTVNDWMCSQYGKLCNICFKLSKVSAAVHAFRWQLFSLASSNRITPSKGESKRTDNPKYLYAVTSELVELIMSPLRRHIFVCFMAKSAFLGFFSALAP